MNPRQREYYEQELVFLRDSAAEFARQFPDVASRLALDATSAQGACVDPYVERLLEGVAFLSARVRIKLDAQFPRLTQSLLQLVYPGFLAPLPSVGVVQVQPDLNEPALADGVVIAWGSAMNSRLGPGQRTRCRFTTGHELRLWPLQLGRIDFQSDIPKLPQGLVPDLNLARSCMRVGVQVTAGLNADQVKLDRLEWWLSGEGLVARRLQEQLLCNSLGVVVLDAGKVAGFLPAEAIEPIGYDDTEALLPLAQSGFGGYRLLQEYAALPARFLFCGLSGLRPLLAGITGKQFELVFLFSRPDTVLERSVGDQDLALNCVPVINLFRKSLNRVPVSTLDLEYHVVPDRSTPLDFEVYDIERVMGFMEGATTSERAYEPLYGLHHLTDAAAAGYFSVRREPRLMSEHQRQRGARSGYLGTEVFLSVVDRSEQRLAAQQKQLGVEAWCTNRDLPLLLETGRPDDLSLDVSAPIKGITFRAPPSRPGTATVEGEVPWKLISTLSLNYLSIQQMAPEAAAAALREMLAVSGVGEFSSLRKHAESVVSVSARPVMRRLQVAGNDNPQDRSRPARGLARPLAFGRGVEITVVLDERAFDGSSCFLFGSLLERYFARHASLNSFTVTVLESSVRGEIKRWKPRAGQRTTF